MISPQITHLWGICFLSWIKILELSLRQRCFVVHWRPNYAILSAFAMVSECYKQSSSLASQPKSALQPRRVTGKTELNQTVLLVSSVATPYTPVVPGVILACVLAPLILLTIGMIRTKQNKMSATSRNVHSELDGNARIGSVNSESGADAAPERFRLQQRLIDLISALRTSSCVKRPCLNS